MRNLNRNKRELWYALYQGTQPVVDDQGYETGEYALSYGDITRLDCNVSAASGAEAVQAFGNMTNYSRTITIADPDCPLDEDAIVWFGADTTKPHNYIVTRKADSKNGVMYALQEVSVS